MRFIIVRQEEGFGWRLCGKDGLELCRNGALKLASVAAARQDIVKVKRAMAGVRFAKVEEAIE